MKNLLGNRVKLANLPTPIHHYPRLSEEFGFELFVKRDDLTESVASGNKIRKLEYVLYEALREGADTLVTCGGVQSNHCRAVAWTAAKNGLNSVLLLKGARPAHLQGNLLLSDLLGAKARFCSDNEYANIDALAGQVCAELRSKGKKPFWIPLGASTATGSLGYVNMVRELQESGTTFDHIYCAVGSAGTFAGILLGCQYYNLPTPPTGIAVCNDTNHFMKELNRIQSEFKKSYRLSVDLSGAGPAIDDSFVGKGYALNTDEELRQLIRLARAEGLVLDPVYTLKAFLGLIGHSRDGRIKKKARVLFVHSGGHAGLLSKNEELEPLLV